MKSWNNWASLEGLNLEYWSNKSPIESGVRFDPGWSCNISFMESVVMVNILFLSRDIIALRLGM